MAVAFDAAASNKAAYPANTSTISVNHTVAAGSDLFLLVSVGWYNAQGARTVSGVTWNGTAMTAVPSSTVATSGAHNVQLWYLINPATGAHTVTVTMSGNDDLLFVGVSSWSGVHQTAPLGTAVTNTGTSTTGQVTLSSAADEYVAGCITHEAIFASDFSTSDTELYEQFDNTTNLHSGAYSVGSASVSLDWLGGKNAEWAASGVPIKPVGGGGGATVFPAHYYQQQRRQAA